MAHSDPSPPARMSATDSDRRRQEYDRNDELDGSSSRRKHSQHRHSKSQRQRSSGSVSDQERRSHKRDRSRHRSQDRDRERRHRERSPDARSRSISRDRHRHRRHRSGSRDKRRNHRSHSRERRKRHDRSRSRDKRKRDQRSRSPLPRSKAPLPSQNDSFRAIEGGPSGDAATPVEKQKPNFKPTGLLAKEANTVEGTTTVLKYHEPPNARKPSTKEQWRMYVFKKKDLLDTIYIHQRSCWLIGRDETVTDLFVEHPSISKQHAVIQFRYITSRNKYGEEKSKVKPYLIDLESANGTLLNGGKVETSRFVELVDGDVVKFGESEREYVLMLPPPDS